MSIQPERPAKPTGVFDRFAEHSSAFVSGGAFFGVSVLLVLLWLPTIFVIASVDTWQLVLNTIVSVLAFLLVALLQNSQKRNEIALQRKLDAIASGLADLLELEHRQAREPDALARAVARLRGSIELERG
jgi:low affinity Fe/Cu permease